MNKQLLTLTLTTTVTTALAGTAQTSGDPFLMRAIDPPAGHLAQAESGPGTTGEQLKRGGISVTEGTCGEGKCGALPVREAMNVDGNGLISRKEYLNWTTNVAGGRFDRIDVDDDGAIDAGEMANYQVRQ